ncbi:MAG: copper homeostasis protein CutC [Dysgonamonadaceae bacterium]|jgi:copper homeostasis protein|nr:copper homeostasis protein CutC [Dysgonamonadaceae bacterium]
MKKNKILLEICADSVSSALIAQSAGASRIEFCADLPEGGVTPSYSQILIARSLLEIKLYVLIRPRGGDFLYNKMELDIIKSDIDCCGKLGCDGVVIGMLRKDGTVDKESCRELVELAHSHSMGVTFHRAFDRSVDLFQAMEDIIDLGCERILTSGGYDTVIEGADVISQLIKKADGRIIIMPGSGVTPENAPDLIQKTGLTELHGTFRSYYQSNMQYRNTQLSHQNEEYGFYHVDEEKIKNLIKQFK